MPAAPPLLFTDLKSGELRRRRWSLSVVDGVDTGASATIDSTPALIGAAPAATLVLTDDTVSRYHLELDIFAEGIRLRDLDSTNGTFVGPTRIRDAFVEAGDTFRLGRTTVRAIAIEEAAAPEIDTDPLGLPLGAIERIGSALAVSIPMRGLFEDLRKVARSPSSVLLEGDAGAGKATCARILHDLSPRKAAPYIRVTVKKGVETSDVERLFFGSGEADGSAQGAYEQAAGGTLFIEHVDHVPQSVQRRILRAIESGEVPSKSDQRKRRIDVRWIAATSSPSARVTLEPRLLRRLAVVRLRVPSLEERTEDLAPLARAFLASKSNGSPPLMVGPRLGAALANQMWPGNVDALEAALTTLVHADAWFEASEPPGALRHALIEDAIAMHAGSVTAAARMLGSTTRALFAFAARADVDVDASDAG